MVKRYGSDGDEPASKRSKLALDVRQSFREHLFEETEQHAQAYAISEPYKHSVINGLIDDELLRKVRAEITENISFAEKETDIYTIWQSGDLKNLDGLEDAALRSLPSLLELRNALYSHDFRNFLQGVCNCGPLSGQKTDMAINVYKPGCHLLCHDDVIGTRRLSYILYLTDADDPWQSAWGGALRLYPTEERRSRKTNSALPVPLPEFSRSIPPAWNQLSFFEVQPGRSFHDVEEVYSSSDGVEDDRRVRMAISGWFHIPQEGEENYNPDLERQLAAKESSLNQLQSAASEYDRPLNKATQYVENTEKASEADDSIGKDEFNEGELNFLLKYVRPDYLIPGNLDPMRIMFKDDYVLRVDNFLNNRFAKALFEYIRAEEEQSRTQCVPPEEHGNSTDVSSPANGKLSSRPRHESTIWQVACPPHKHKYLFQDATTSEAKGPVQELMSKLFASKTFKKWLKFATGINVRDFCVKTRRFRRGCDYTLGEGLKDQAQRLDLTLGITTSKGWELEDPDEERNETEDDAPLASNDKNHANGNENGVLKYKLTDEAWEIVQLPNFGGDEIFMYAEDDEEEEDDNDDDDPSFAKVTKPPSKAKSDPAVYKASTKDEDNGVIFSMAPSWNRLSLVLRAEGDLRFVKYVSKSAPGDRFDVVAEYGIAPEDEIDVMAGDASGEDNLEEVSGANDAEAADEEEESFDEEEDMDDMEEAYGAGIAGA